MHENFHAPLIIKSLVHLWTRLQTVKKIRQAQLYAAMKFYAYPIWVIADPCMPEQTCSFQKPSGAQNS